MRQLSNQAIQKRENDLREVIEQMDRVQYIRLCFWAVHYYIVSICEHWSLGQRIALVAGMTAVGISSHIVHRLPVTLPLAVLFVAIPIIAAPKNTGKI